MDVAKGTAEEFVTVVSVGQPISENFVTVLSIGNGKKDYEESSTSNKNLMNGVEGYLEEEVEVFRLPGERLGFGLKFEGGNKTSERVRRLFVQSCAEQSPASRAKCSWGTLGEGDEVLSIDGVPVTHMTRLDCVRRLKESQLVIRLMVRCRGALRPEVVSAERKTSTEKNKVPPELPVAPPPVPPRKLRHPRGSADGEANPSPVKRLWDTSKSQNGSQNSTLTSQVGSQNEGKAGTCENSEWHVNGSNEENVKGGGEQKERSSELTKSKQEPPEAMVYLDARSQCGSTHGSTSDETGSSMSTVVDRFSTSDRVSTISTGSTTSTASEQPNEFPSERDFDRSSDRDVLRSRAIFPFEHLERDFSSNPPDYLLRRLANSEAVTHVESRGEVERITAVVAPNIVLIEETITLQPPLSFQDAPLSYGNETRPDLFYAADLAADSTTHFRPIKDDVDLVECVNGNYEEFREATADTETFERRKEVNTPPPLPARNHVNRICVNQTKTSESGNETCPRITIPVSVLEKETLNAPLLPPKPLPRKDIKTRRKRPPPPPPPPIIKPRKEIKSIPLNTELSSIEPNHTEKEMEKENDDVPQIESIEYVRQDSCNSSSKESDVYNEKNPEIENPNTCESPIIDSAIKNTCIDNEIGTASEGDLQINKVSEIIEIRMSKNLLSTQKQEIVKNDLNNSSETAYNPEVTTIADQNETKDRIIDQNKQDQLIDNSKILAEHHNPNLESIDKHIENSKDNEIKYLDLGNINREDVKINNQDTFKEILPSNGENHLLVENSVLRENEDDETYQSLDELNDDMKNPEVNRMLEDEEITEEEEDTSDESDVGDYYWQSNLATIGEEEETNSLEYVNANMDVDASNSLTAEEEKSPTVKKDTFAQNARDDEADRVNGTTEYTKKENNKPNKGTVNARMENCGGGQRLPPDGDEFPAAYQEFGNSGNQQYRYLAVARTTMITANGGLCNENESFRESETFKLLVNDNDVVDSRSIILPNNKMTSTESVRQDINNAALTNIDKNVRSDVEKPVLANVDNVCQDVKFPEISNDERKSPYQTSEDIVKRNIAPSIGGSSPFPCQTNNGALLMNEKKIEIAGYYHKDITTIEEVPNHVEKGTHIDTPPPLPLTGPPKIEPIVSHARSVPTTIETPQRKFSLNGELWRQDDKSERSVRDKIAMFSSQSNLDSPLFPNAMTAAAAANNGKRLSKYKSSEDVCCDDKSNGQKDRSSFFTDRTQSSFDLTDSASTPDSAKKYSPRVPSLLQATQTTLFSPSMQTARVPKTLPVVPPKITSSPLISSYEKQTFSNTTTKNYCAIPCENNSSQNIAYINKGMNSCSNSSNNSSKSSSTSSLTRATSFSGSTAFVQDRNATTADSLNNSQISRTNSLASTFRRPGEDARRSSLNQLIEQRRRSISKLRGLIIPEKDTVPIDQPIVDLPEIKSRDSILLHQTPKANIQDKWGSQNSLASNASTTSIPLKATSFKMPAPQIHSKYSPAFKRKSLTVYGTSITGSMINGNAVKNSPTVATSALSEPPKSLESICSPTRSDYSFEFASATNSPDGSRNRPRTIQRKARLDYDDSDNDSAVSSSQSSISRGFSPPTSPAPSERSTLSSDRSYISMEMNYQRRPLLADSLSRSSSRDIRDPFGMEKDQTDSRIGVAYGERTYLSDGSSSNSNSPNPRLSQLNDLISKNSHIPQKQLRRSNSTDTNCSTSSTLTSGSQASAESLSRRVLKPQSVEAINRKNILASARCRSGRDLNGSPLIQRKFSDDEDGTAAIENGGATYKLINNSGNDVTNKQEIKIAYIEVPDSFAQDGETCQKKEEEPELPPKRSIPSPAVRPPKSEMLEPSNDLKMWVHAEAKTLARITEEKSNSKYKKTPSTLQSSKTSSVIHTMRQNSHVSMFEELVNSVPNGDLSSKNRNVAAETEISKQQNRANVPSRKNTDDQNDLLTILTTKSRSRSAIHVDEGIFGKSKSQMSLEDILRAKADSKSPRAQNVETKIEKNGMITSSPVKPTWDSKENRYIRRNSSTSNDFSSEDKPFVSKIPTLGKLKTTDGGNEIFEINERMKNSTSKIPTSRSLNRRSASVTDMKKVLEKVDTSSIHSQLHHSTGSNHNRFPSLDSSVDENVCTSGTETDTDRCYGESFGSISSLASSTSLISQQELAQLVEEASLEEARGAHDVIVVLLHKENPTGSVGITLAGGADCEVKEITVHRVLTHSIADKDGRVQRGDRILSINGRSTRGLTHRESMTVLKQPRSEVVLVVSRARIEEGCKLKSRTASVETIVEGLETNGNVENTAWGPPLVVAVYKDGAGLGFSLEGGRDSPLGDRPLIIKKIFTGGAAEKTGALKAGDQLLEVNGSDVTRMSRIEAWSLMKKLHDGEVNLLVRHPATKSS